MVYGLSRALTAISSFLVVKDMKNGWIKLYRKIFESEIADIGIKGYGFAAYCLLKANHQNKEWFDGVNRVIIKRGQFISSLENMAKELKIGVQQLRTLLQKFKTIDFLTSQSTSRYTVITIIKYGNYQDIANELTSISTDEQQTDNIRLTTNKNVKNDKNVKKLGTPSVPEQQIKELIDLFKAVNPSYAELFKRLNQRAALKRMVGKFGYDKVRAAIEKLPSVIIQKYAPKITTPIQLENRLGELVAFVRQEQSKVEVAKSKTAIIQ